MPETPKPPTPYEYIRTQIAEVIVATVKTGIPVTQAEFTAAFLTAAAEGAVLQSLPLDQFNELAAQFYQEAKTEIEAAAAAEAPAVPAKPVTS